MQTVQVAERYCSWKGCFYIWLCPKHLEVLVALERQAQTLGGPEKPNVISSLQMLPVITFWPDQSPEWAIPRVRRDKVQTQDEVWHLKSLSRYPEVSSTRLAGTPLHKLSLVFCAAQHQVTPSIFLQLQHGALPSNAVRPRPCSEEHSVQSGTTAAPSSQEAASVPGLNKKPGGWGIDPVLNPSGQRAVTRGHPTQEGPLHLSVSPAQQL